MPPNQWEEHKVTIQCLYLLDNLKLEDVRSRMREEHGFDMKKYQYEYQLKKWGIKKNHTREEWRYLTHKVRKRKQAGKMSIIELSGIPLAPDKARREMHRYTTIPTASQFGMRAPSPQSPAQSIVRVTTPDFPSFHDPWPQNLPWLQFTMLFNFKNFQASEAAKLPTITSDIILNQAAFSNPLHVCKEVSARLLFIPHNSDRDGQSSYASLCKGGEAAITTGLLKIILYHLANKDFEKANVFGASTDDEVELFILQCLDWFTKYKADWLIDLLRTRSPTTDAITEVVYNCAIRQKRHALLSQLIQAGATLNLNAPLGYYKLSRIIAERGTLRIEHALADGWSSNGLTIAIAESDTRLANILLESGANPYACKPSFLEQAAMSLEEELCIEYIKSLIGRGFSFDWAQPLSIAVIKRHNNLAVFLMELLRQNSTSEEQILHWLTAPFENRDWDYAFPLVKPTLLHFAIVSNNTAITKLLLDMTLSSVGVIRTQVLKDLFVVASLAGDLGTIERLVGLDLEWDGDWPDGISPLVGTAWNPNFRVAEMIVRAGAYTDDDIEYYGSDSRRPLPIHVAARAGNANLVQWLVRRGRALNVRFKPKPGRLSDSIWSWFVDSYIPSSSSWSATPLQLALKSRDIATITQFSHAELVGDELITAVRLNNEAIVSALLQRGANVLSKTDEDSVLDAAAEVGNSNIISLYFSSGGVYRSSALLRAVRAAVALQDLSFVQLLVSRRPVKNIDKFEASALVIAAWKAQISLIAILLDPKFLPNSVPSVYHFPHLKNDNLGFSLKWPEKGLMPLSAVAAKGDRGLFQRLLQAGHTIRSEELDMNYLTDPERESALSVFVSFFPPTTIDSNWTKRLLHRYIEIGDQQGVEECVACLESLAFYIQSRTALQRAVEGGNIRLIRLLMDKGADINAEAASEAGATALQITAIKGDMHIARILLAHEAHVNQPGAKKYGRTALEGASEHGRLDMVKLLLDHGAQLDGAMRIQYIRSIAFANEAGHFALAKFLKHAGGWSDRDQEIYGRRNILHGPGYWAYTAETHDWHFRKVTTRQMVHTIRKWTTFQKPRTAERLPK
ncbi:hypothetical protein GGR57DRAFT_464744 [Xylariaceae sp. FL1272]|nr:hypothetical protein GGR57DRAFT_464744 [Xylariaceae sp. FL1272]